MTRPSRPASLIRAPRPFVAHCRQSAVLRTACPSTVPAVTEPYRARTFSRAPRGEFATFDAQSGALHPDASPENRPPRFAHIVIEAGDLRHAYQTFAYPQSGRPVRVVAGLLRSSPRMRAAREHIPHALFIGEFRWGGRTGTVTLAPPDRYVDSLIAGHFAFRWTQGDRDYVVSLHAWEPAPEALATLRAVVASLR
jgi:hypothetical protein